MTGSLVVFPTDTVYGVGTSPRSISGILRCFELKKRPVEKKVPILFSSTDEASKFVFLDERALLLANAFWPGQLTMILPLRDLTLPKELTGDDGTLAARVPNNNCCLRLITACGHSLIGTSANFSGSGPFNDPEDPLLLEFSQGADYFVKGTCGKKSLTSTILDLSKPNVATVLREGAISSDILIDYLAKTNKADFSINAVNNSSLVSRRGN